jgi:hypothetical protein
VLVGISWQAWPDVITPETPFGILHADLFGGKRNLQEATLDCALREFGEESTLDTEWLDMQGGSDSIRVTRNIVFFAGINAT